MKKKKLGAIIAGVLVAGAIGYSAITTVRIKAGYVGIQYNMNGGIEKATLGQGWHFFIPPTKHIVEYPVATTQVFLSKNKKEGEENDSFLIPTSDGKTVNVDLEFAYHFDEKKLPQTYTRFAGESAKNIEETFMRVKMKSWSQEVSSKFSVMDIYGSKRADLNTAVLDHARVNFAQYGIIIDSVNFSRIEPDAQTEQAIQSRINAEQELEKAKIDKEKAEIEAQKKKVEAEGTAEATRIGAEAEANANKLKQSTLNDTIVKYETVKKWNGSMPNVMGGNINPIIDMNGLTSEK